ncbi:MAG: hypothetical protein WCO86_09260 [Planctomycetota bacterium]
MKTLYIVLVFFSAGGMVAEAGLRGSRLSGNSNCSPTTSRGNTCATTRWYKAKDGTCREMLPYAKALSRAEDADDMEIELENTQSELATVKTSIEAVQSEAAKLQAAMQSQIAELTQQLEAERQTVSVQKERGDKAEASHKQSVDQIANLRDAAKKMEESVQAVQAEIKKTTEERDSLKIARAELEQKLTDMTAAKTAAEAAALLNQQELEKFKQEAAESKKAAIEAEEKAKDEVKPDADKPATDGGAAPSEEVPQN